MYQNINNYLFPLKDDKYKHTVQKLLPGVNNILGVRLPLIHNLAKDICKHDYASYLSMSYCQSFEETMLHGFVIAYCKMTAEDKFTYLDEFIPKINNWSICDSVCNSLKFMKYYQERSFEYIKKYIISEREFEVRFFLACIIFHFINERYIDEILAILPSIQNNRYYAKMAMSWLICECCAFFPEKTCKFIRQSCIDTFVYQKAIQKINQSYKISAEIKKTLRGYG